MDKVTVKKLCAKLQVGTEIEKYLCTLKIKMLLVVF